MQQQAFIYFHYDDIHEFELCTFSLRMDHHCLSKLNLMGGCNVQTIELQTHEIGIYSIRHILSPVSFIHWSQSYGNLHLHKVYTNDTDMLRCVAEGIPISGQVPKLCLLVQSDVLREQLGVQKKQSGSRPPLPRQHPQHQGLHGGQHLPLHTEHLSHAHQVCNPLNIVSEIDSLTPNEWVSWTMNHFLSE